MKMWQFTGKVDDKYRCEARVYEANGFMFGWVRVSLGDAAKISPSFDSVGFKGLKVSDQNTTSWVVESVGFEREMPAGLRIDFVVKEF